MILPLLCLPLYSSPLEAPVRPWIYLPLLVSGLCIVSAVTTSASGRALTQKAAPAGKAPLAGKAPQAEPARRAHRQVPA